jgi:hypothetical protein
MCVDLIVKPPRTASSSAVYLPITSVDGCLERELPCQHLNERLDFVAGNIQVLHDMAG